MAKKSSHEAYSRPPLSTYRVQLNLNFTFGDAERVVGYLRDLGVSDLYASPYLQARAGSLHGYDISDHNTLNEELGGEEAHESLMRALRDHGLGHLLDVVPNHMGIGELTNTWWMDVLENGPSSPFASYFDIDWTPLKSELVGKVLLPVLGDQFGIILERGELRLFFEEGRFRIGYHEHVFPVAPGAAPLVLRAILERMKDVADAEDEDAIELESIVTALEHLPPRSRTDRPSVAERRRESFVSRRRLTALHDGSALFRTALKSAIEAYNGRVGDPHSFDDLETLLDDQAYRLAYWRVAAQEINYRRFFDINHLAGIRVERGEVFQATHRLILRLLAEEKVTSLRIDHPDGLFDPYGYLRDLQDAASARVGGGKAYIVVEKILTGDEPLPERWPVAGTVGYEFINRVNGLFVASENAAEMTRVYHEFIGDRVNFGSLAYDKKKLILRVALASELNVLGYLLNRLSEKNRRFRDFTLGALTDAIREAIACFPVYRTYIDAPSGTVHEADREYVERAVRTAIRRNRATSPTIFNFIRNILLLEWPDDLDEDSREEHALFVMKFQQLTGPVMAKGVEDTSFYIYNRLVSLNEVGGEPDHFGVAPDRLHAWLEERSRTWPLALSNSTTHDTKRSEDVRARINVLSEIPREWAARVQAWAEMNASKRSIVDGDAVPDANDEYLLYQTLVGAWPLEIADDAAAHDFRARIQQYMEKATREAKLHTSWINPNEDFDEALRGFIARVLDFEARVEASPFLTDLVEFQSEVARAGMVNSLAQTLVKLTAPGVPDVYQGQEIWDFSLVDPDNRRDVDYEKRMGMLAGLRERLDAGDRQALAAEVVREWRDGRIKLLVHHLGLRLRQERRDLFFAGDYLPLEVEGERAEHVFAFARRFGDEVAIVAVPRLAWTFRSATGADVTDARAWGDTRIVVPEGMGTWANVFTGRDLGAPERLTVGEVLGGLPVGLLVRGFQAVGH